MTRDETLRLPNSEPTLNGRCVGQLQNGGAAGTVLEFVWHDPAGCEHYVCVQTNPRITEVRSPSGERLGRVLRLSSTFRASRRSGTADDMRRVADGFRSIDTAARWVAER